MDNYKENTIRIEKHERIIRGKKSVRYIYIHKCLSCDNEVRIFGHKQSGKCISCSGREKPFHSLWIFITNNNKSRGVENLLSYEEFLEFTNIKNCHYCNEEINWHPWRQYKGKYLGRGYNLDRKDSSSSYSKDNCVVCCKDCNITRMDRYSYEEFLLISPILRRIKEDRRNNDSHIL